jgi:hypothetical protein
LERPTFRIWTNEQKTGKHGFQKPADSVSDH